MQHLNKGNTLGSLFKKGGTKIALIQGKNSLRAHYLTSGWNLVIGQESKIMLLLQ